VRLPGRLTLHGQERPLVLPAQARWDGATIQVAGGTQIRMADYGMELTTIAGYKVEDRGTIEFELTLRRAGTPAAAATPSTLQRHPEIPAGGGEPGRPTAAPCRRGRPLPAGGGRLLFGAEEGSTDLFVVGADGRGLRRVTEDPGSEESEPSWSPDGRRIAYTQWPHADMPPPGVHIAAADGSKDRDLAGGEFMTQPAWSPDGRQIAYVASRDGGDVTDIWVMRSDGSGKRKLTGTASGNDDPAWSPGGDQIAFSIYGGPGNQDVAVVNADGSGLRRLTSSAAYEYGPAWSPDGRRIAYVRDGAIHVMRADGSRDRRITRGTKDGGPAWSPDGTRLSFVRDGSILVARADGSGAACLPVGRTVTSAARWQPGA
jgi:TolB protein